MTPAQFDEFVRDTVNFLEYAGEPAQAKRLDLGVWVTLFLLLFAAFMIATAAGGHSPSWDQTSLHILAGAFGLAVGMGMFALGWVGGGDAKDDDRFFDMDQMRALHDKQRKNVEYLDRLFEKLYEVVPPNTHIMVMSDHGELFGEDGYFGHGPIIHEKVFEVFFVEGRIK